MAPIVAQASLLASQLHAAVRARVSEGKGDDVVQLLECLRKADKVVMYSLSSMPAGYQYREDTSAVLRGVVERISEFDRLLDMVSGELRIQAEKYV